MIASTLHYICVDMAPDRLSIRPWSYGLLGLPAIRCLVVAPLSLDVICVYFSSGRVASVRRYLSQNYVCFVFAFGLDYWVVRT